MDDDLFFLILKIFYYILLTCIFSYYFQNLTKNKNKTFQSLSGVLVFIALPLVAGIYSICDLLPHCF